MWKHNGALNLPVQNPRLPPGDQTLPLAVRARELLARWRGSSSGNAAERERFARGWSVSLSAVAWSWVDMHVVLCVRELWTNEGWGSWGCEGRQEGGNLRFVVS